MTIDLNMHPNFRDIPSWAIDRLREAAELGVYPEQVYFDGTDIRPIHELFDVSFGETVYQESDAHGGILLKEGYDPISGKFYHEGREVLYASKLSFEDVEDPYALPTGTISMSQVNVELGHASNRTISLNQSDVRKLAGKTSGTISMNDLRGKSSSLLDSAATIASVANGHPCGPTGYYRWVGYSRIVQNLAWSNLGSMAKNTFTDSNGRSRKIICLLFGHTAPPNICPGGMAIDIHMTQHRANSGWSTIKFYIGGTLNKTWTRAGATFSSLNLWHSNIDRWLKYDDNGGMNTSVNKIVIE